MSIQFQNPYNQHLLAKTEEGLIDENENVFPFSKGAYKIVEDNNYTDNFGFQWNKFAETQVDKANNLNISYVRFFAETNWDKEDLIGKNILEIGSGAGRFSQIILDYTKGNLYSVDYSNAVEANFKNNGTNDRLHLFQASIYELPFVKGQFDKVICLGVLQHTPDFEKSVKCLIEMAKPGAEVIVDFYPINGWWTKLNAKYLFRPYTRKLNHEKLYKKIDSNIDWLISAYNFFSRIKIGKLVNRFLPICDINATLPQKLTYPQLRELCLLDTFDMYSPQFDDPQKINTVVGWFEKYGMENVWGGKIHYENCAAAVVKGIKTLTDKNSVK